MLSLCKKKRSELGYTCQDECCLNRNTINDTNGNDTIAQVRLTQIGARCTLGASLWEVGESVVDAGLQRSHMFTHVYIDCTQVVAKYGVMLPSDDRTTTHMTIKSMIEGMEHHHNTLAMVCR